MGLAPQHGLYAALIPLLVYPFFASSRQVIVGPDIAICLLIGSTVGPLAGGDPAHAAVLAAAVALLSGGLLNLAAQANLGVVADFLSKPVLVGYMTGAALILMASQLDKLFGIKIKSTEFFPRVLELGTQFNHAHGLTILLGLGCLVALFSLHRLCPKVPATLVICVVAIAVSATL